MADCLSNAANKAKSSSRFNNGALFEAQESFERERELEPAPRAPRARYIHDTGQPAFAPRASVLTG